MALDVGCHTVCLKCNKLPYSRASARPQALPQKNWSPHLPFPDDPPPPNTLQNRPTHTHTHSHTQTVTHMHTHTHTLSLHTKYPQIPASTHLLLNIQTHILLTHTNAYTLMHVPIHTHTHTHLLMHCCLAVVCQVEFGDGSQVMDEREDIYSLAA